MTGHDAGSSDAGTTTRCGGALALALLLALAVTILSSADRSPAQEPAGPTTVSVPEAVERTCFERRLAGAAGAATVEVPAPALGETSLGLVEARLEGPPGSDWDLTVFDADGDVVAGSASRGRARSRPDTCSTAAS